MYAQQHPSYVLLIDNFSYVIFMDEVVFFILDIIY